MTIKKKTLTPSKVKRQLEEYYREVSVEEFIEDDKRANPDAYKLDKAKKKKTELEQFLKETEPERETA